jgi:hypothetical protein
MKLVWRIVGEVFQVLLWMAGLGLVAMIVGRTLEGFLSLPIWLKASIWFAVAVVCKHGRDISLWYEKQRIEARQHPDLRI